jgi:DNA-binding NarL/FixJ family response regulator
MKLYCDCLQAGKELPLKRRWRDIKKNYLAAPSLTCTNTTAKSTAIKYHLSGAYAGVVLTKKQRDILVYMLHKYKINDIAKRLRLSNRTIEKYISNIKEKLGLKHVKNIKKFLADDRKLLCDLDEPQFGVFI